MPDWWTSIPGILREWFPAFVAAFFSLSILLGFRWALLVRWAPATGQSRMNRQLLIAAVAGVLLIVFILALPIGESEHGQLLSLIGLLVSAAIALSSTTLLGNAMAGMMLRSMRNFRPGDFIAVGEYRGRVSDKALLRTEIQTQARDLVTLPNLYLVNNPVTVVRSSGTFVSAKVSLGYDVPIETVRRLLLASAEGAGLTEAFMRVLELGDFSVTYQIAGFLDEVKYLITAESKLREGVLKSLHEGGVEIVSPNFMNQRVLDPKQLIIPRRERSRALDTAPDEHPEDLMFDKAEEAENVGKLELELAEITRELAELKSQSKDAGADDANVELSARRVELDAQKAELEEQISLRDSKGTPTTEGADETA